VLRILPLFLVLAVSLLGGGCASTTPAHRAQQERISQEPSGDYWVGRRFHWQGTRVWGYVRKPRQSWKSSRLVIVDENSRRQPDRLPEMPTDSAAGLLHGFDHNYEYRLWGAFSGSEAYDPNGNLTLPVFRLERLELITRNPGFVFNPGDERNQRRLPRRF